MDWYYIKDGQQVGPVDDPTFTALARQGTIGPSDRVWNASMGSEWSYAADVPGLFPAEAPAWHQATDSRAGRPAGSLTPNASLTEHPGIGVNEAIGRSKAMMRGNRWKLFCLSCRFIGWTLLSLLTCGIGWFFLMPYMQVSFAHFYEDIR